MVIKGGGQSGCIHCEETRGGAWLIAQRGRRVPRVPSAAEGTDLTWGRLRPPGLGRLVAPKFPPNRITPVIYCVGLM